MKAHRALVCVVLAIVFSAGAAATVARAQGESADPILAEARRLFDALDYERAVAALDRVIALVEPRTPRDDQMRAQLVTAYELRARSRFGLNDREGARSDFQMLLRIDPGHVLPAVSPRVVTLFQEVRKALVGSLNLSITPADAEVQVDGVPMIRAAGPAPIVAGTHSVMVRKPGYRPATQSVTVNANGNADLTVALERVSAIVSVVTTPAEVEVLVDGASRGVTQLGPAPPEYATADIAAVDLSKPLTIADVTTGSHTIEFRKPCYVGVEQRLNVERPADFRMDPVKLNRAIGKVSIEGGGGNVFLDGQPRGTAPMALDDVCEGRHVLEVRSAYGRWLNRLDMHTGDNVAVTATLRPAVALLSAVGLPEGLRGVDLRETVEKAFQPLRGMTLFAPPADQVAAALAAEKLAPGWLSFDTGRRAIGDAAANITANGRQDVSSRLTHAFDAQGVAVVTVASKEDQARVLLTILAAGSGEPDTVEVDLNEVDSIGRAIARLDSGPSLFRASAGVQAIDVLDVPGPVIVGTEPAAGGQPPAVVAGEVITAANGQPVPDVAHLEDVVKKMQPGNRLVLEVQDRTGAARQVDGRLVRVPALVAMADQTLLFNPLLLDLRRRLAGQADPSEEPVIRLNLGVALMRVGNWAAARAELERVRLPDGPGVAAGTVHYLLGLCHEAVGDFGQAEAAWRAATASKGATLTIDGPPVKELADRKLAELARRVR